MYLNQHQLVGHLHQRVEADVDLRLAGGGHLVVLALDLDAHRVHHQGHFGADVVLACPWEQPGNSLPCGGSCSRRFRALLLATGVPGALDSSRCRRRRRSCWFVEADVVEDEELRLGAEVGGVGDARRAQVGFSALRAMLRGSRL